MLERRIVLGNNEDKQRVDRQGNKLWPALSGGIVGAVVVGAAWGLIAHTHQMDPLLAKVGSNQIHQSQFQTQMEELAGQQTMQQMVDNQLIKDGAKAQHITASKQDLSQAVQRLEAQYRIQSNTQLNQFLKSNGLTRPQLNDILTVNILEQKLSEQGITVSNKDIQTYYDKNKARFTLPGKKTPQPLSAVRSQIVSQIKQSRAIPRATLLAQLAKKDKVTIYDAKYKSIQTKLEPPTTTSSTGATGGTSTSGGSNSTASNSSSTSTSTSNSTGSSSTSANSTASSSAATNSASNSAGK